VCHALLEDASFWAFIHQLDIDIAAQVRRQGCPHCGGKLHSACYPRKPRGVCRHVLGEAYCWRLSFCCASSDCRRRCTPTSLRFLGRKVYLGLVITLFSSAEQSAGGASRQQLIETLGVSAQTLHRWRYWWQVTLPVSRVWKSLRSRLMPPLLSSALPTALLMAMNGSGLAQRLLHAVALLLPLSSASCARSIRLNLEPQKM
jgi:hypothetical protein